MSFLRLEGLVKQFGDFVAVENMDLSVEKGEFVSLLGPSGCGKTTTLQMIAGFVQPTAGRVMINGKDVTHVKPNKRDLGIVFQSYALFQHMTVFDNVAFGLEMRNVDKAEREERVLETLGLVHLRDFAHRFPRELSGGQQQRVALARALVIKPEVLLLDEPLSALDAKIREDMQMELRAIQRTVGTTTILVTHDQHEAMAMSDRIAVMHKGKLAQVDQPFNTYEHPSDHFVSNFLGKSNIFVGQVKDKTKEFDLITVAGVDMPVQPQPFKQGQPLHVSLRPEKLHIVPEKEGIISGVITSQIFLGDHWVFQVQTELGEVMAISQNTGRQDTREGMKIGLKWYPEEVRLLALEDDHAA